MSIINNMPNKSNGNSSINGLIEEYYVYAGEDISAGDLVEFVNGIASKVDYGTSVQSDLSTTTWCGMAPWALQLPDGRIFLSHAHTSNSYLGCSILTVEGTTITTHITTQLITTKYLAGTKSILLPSGNIYIAYNSDAYLCGVVVKIEGNTITAGETISFGSYTATDYNITGATALLEEGVLVPHASQGSDVQYLYATAVTISGLVATKGTLTELWDSHYDGAYITGILPPCGVPLVMHNEVSSDGSTTGTVGLMHVTAVNGTIIAGNHTRLSSGGATLYAALTNEKKVFLIHGVYATIIDTDGSNISWGTAITTEISTVGNSNVQSASATQDNKMVITNSPNSSVAYLYGSVVLTNGTTITLGGSSIQLSGDSAGGRGTANLVLPNNTILVTGTRAGSDRYLRGQIWRVDNETNQLTNEIKYEETETQVRKVTTAKIEAVAKTSGEGGDETSHKDKIEVYVPFTGYNLIPDASFENDQWDGANYSAEVYRLGNRALYFPVGTTYVANIEIERPIVGHKYYGRRYIKSNGNNTPADCRFEVWGADGANMNWVYAWNQGNHPNWEFGSEIHEIASVDYPETDRTIIRCFNVSTTADTWVDDLLLVDLTAMFGAGNEPSKEWCDDNL